MMNNENRCMLCGRCSAACPMAARMDLPPHMWVYRTQRGDPSSVRKADAIWKCLSCLCCEARCPRGVKPAHVAEEARAGQGYILEDVMKRVDENMPQQLPVAALRKARG
ncbi:MAG: 4Fe-4S dicluster domain-containing protein [Defluviitaleaceae bacterium]|nr:4Fe-4S dicluster domain-containing protein [Defluviitaleaceae bacterium]